MQPRNTISSFYSTVPTLQLNFGETRLSTHIPLTPNLLVSKRSHKRPSSMSRTNINITSYNLKFPILIKNLESNHQTRIDSTKYNLRPRFLHPVPHHQPHITFHKTTIFSPKASLSSFLIPTSASLRDSGNATSLCLSSAKLNAKIIKHNYVLIFFIIYRWIFWLDVNLIDMTRLGIGK